MDPKDAAPHPERVETDSSLRAERDRTDEQLATRDADAEGDADQVIELARERADRLLRTARQKVDAMLHSTDASSAQRLVLARATEDGALTQERAAADDKLEAERQAQQEALSLILAVEREETDERLLTERVRSDRVVASRDDFLAIVSHDVRNMLGGMALSTELLLRIPHEGKAAARTLAETQRMQRLTSRMNRLIGDLLDVVSMESGKLEVVPTPQDPTLLLTETMESFQLTATTKTIAMTSDVLARPALVRFDHDRILQVLTNLVGNAMKFTKPGGTIALRLGAIPDAIQFSVCDSGCGIAPAYIDSIFERFSQASQADRRGLGLGLYIARCIVEAHGGKIWAESTPGKGSTFHFILPTT